MDAGSMTSSPDTTLLPLKTLREGDTGEAVAQLQSQLAELALYNGSVSGQFDAETRQALQSFQSQYEISEEDGTLGPQTWYALSFWSKETEWPVPNVWSAFKQWMIKLVDAASVQPEPVLAARTKVRKDVEGQSLFWPPFSRKNHEAA